MKRKLLYLAIIAIIGGTLVIVVVREPSTRTPKRIESQLPTAMSNYHRTFKLDTSPAIFPDGRNTNRPATTNSTRP